jgi:hypothetical protein
MESQMRLGEDAFLGSVSPAALLSRQKKLTLVTFFSLFLQLPATGQLPSCYFGRGESSRSFDQRLIFVDGSTGRRRPLTNQTSLP